MRKIATASAKKLTDEQLSELKANAYDVLCDVRKTLLQRFPFVGSIAMNLDLVPTRDDRLPTAATDGAALYFDIAFLAELKPEERLFVLAHEIYHCVLMHSLRREGRNHQTFNIACDLEVNQLLEADSLITPKDGCFIRNRNHPNGYDFVPNRNAEEYYELLLKKQQYDNATGNNGTQSEGKSDSGNSDGKINGQFDRHIEKNEDLSNEPEQNVQDKYGKVGRDPDFRPNMTEGNVEHIREAAVAAAQMIERQYGELPSHIKNIINQLTEPAVNWRDVLSQFVTRNSGAGENSWNRPNRRFVSTGTYLPSHESKNMNVAVIMDTSGSVYGMLPQFLGELNSLVKSFGNYKLTIIQNDAEVQDVAEYDDENPLDLENVKFQVHGCGGTNLTPAFNYLADNCIEADCVVAMTDGCFSAISPDICSLPTMWLVTKDGTKDAITFGEIIDYDEKN